MDRDVTTPTIEIVARRPFDKGTQAYSGATFEGGLLADGRAVVLKHLPAEGDWLTRATNGVGRARLLWESGVLERVAAMVDHAVLDVFREDGHDVVLMEDVSSCLVPAEGRLPRTVVDTLLAGLATLHGEWEGCELDGLCSPADRHALFVPAFHRSDDGPNPFVGNQFVLDSWEAFADHVPDDVVQAIFAVHAEPAHLEEQLRLAAPWTLLHGDAKLDNLGLRGDRLVAIDWGELTGTGPAEMDLAWLASENTPTLPRTTTPRIDAMPDELFAAYEAQARRRLDPLTLDLACTGMLVQQGFWLAALAFVSQEEAVRTRGAVLLDWWVGRAGEALETWSPS